MRRACASVVALLIAALSVPATASAQTAPTAPETAPKPVSEAARSAARTLGDEGLAAEAAGDHLTALAKFDEAETLVPVPTLGLRAARCLEKLGRWAEAADRFERTARMPIDPTLSDAYRAAQMQARTDASAERAALLSRMPTPITEGGPADSASLDDRPPPPPLVVDRPAARPISPTAERADDSGWSTQKTAGWVTASAGALGLSVGLVTLGLALDRRSSLDAQCTEQTCRESVAGPGAEADVDAYNTVATTSIVALVAGGVLATAGVVLVITAPGASPSTARIQSVVAAAPGPHGGGVGVAALRGSFD